MSQQTEDVSDDVAARKAVRTQVAFGAAFALIGLGMIALVHFHPDGLRAPYGVVVAAMGTFVVAGLSVMARALGWRRLAEGTALVVVFGLAVPGLWLLFEPVGQACTATIGTFGREAAGLECRLVFGIGGVITLAVGVFGAAMFIRRLLRRRPTAEDGPLPERR